MSPSRHRPHHWTTFAILGTAVSAFGLLQSMTVPVLPRIEVEMNTDQSTGAWVLTAYLLSASVFTPIIGRLGDAYGKQRMLVVSLAMLALGSLMAALAPTIGVLIAARAVTGVGGGVLPLAFGIIRDEFPEAKIAGAISIVSSLSAFGLGAGIVLAGPIVTVLGYPWLFWSPFIVTATAAVGAHRLIPKSPAGLPGRVPALPALLLSVWLTALLLALSNGPRWGWASPRVAALLAAALVVAGLWVLLEQRVAVPLIDLKMMRLPAVWTANLVALLVGIGMYASFGFIPQFLQTPTVTGYGFGATTTESGVFTLPTAIGSFAVGFAATPLARRIGPRAVVVVSCLLGAVAMFGMAYAHDAPWQIYVATSIAGLGFGLAFASLAALVVAGVPPEQTGVASGMNANIRTIGGSIGTAAMASIVTSDIGSSGAPVESGYTTGFAVLGVAMLLAAATALAIPRVSVRSPGGSGPDHRGDRPLGRRAGADVTRAR